MRTKAGTKNHKSQHASRVHAGVMVQKPETHMSDHAIQSSLSQVRLGESLAISQPEDFVPGPFHNLDASQVENLLLWVIERARAGVPSEDVTRALVSQGWTPEEAAQAIALSIHKFAPGYANNVNLHNVHQFVVPEPLLANGARLVDCGDRQIEVVMSTLLPRVIVFDGFMSDSECDQLIEAASPKMTPSTVVEPMTGNGVLNPVRTSTGMFFQLAENPVVSLVEARIERLLNWPTNHGEVMQVLNYQPGAEYKPHQDYFDPTDPGTPKAIGFAGQRVGTLLMYLNTPTSGGSTVFPDGGIEVHAKKGRAVFFSYDTPSLAKRALHGGAPVIQGEKWVATKWLRQKPIQPSNVPGPVRKA